jgi:hypothetical protein
MSLSALSYRGRRILETPLLAPDLCRDHAANKGHCNDSRLAPKTHPRSGRSNPLQLEISHAEPSGRPNKQASAITLQHG